MRMMTASVPEANPVTLDDFIQFASPLPSNPNQTADNDAAKDMFCALIVSKADSTGLCMAEAFNACVKDVADSLGMTPACIAEEAPFGIRRAIRKAGLNCGQQAQGWN